MPILDMQLRMRELGRIRTGEQVAAGRGKRPAKLEHFRLTTSSKELLDAAAEIYGGTVVPWESPAGAQWELKTKVDVLPVVIPPGESLSQWYELWTGGGCQRRCDGKTETISEDPCLCPADPGDRRDAANAGQACKPTTRLNVILPDLPDLGVWRLESHGYYAAVELAGAARFLAIASSSGLNIPARLRLDQREKKVPGKPTNRYAVPIIEFTTTRITDLLAAGGTGLPQLEPGSPGQLAPSTVGQTIDPGPDPRKTKTERPPLGKPPALPNGSDFRKPTATAPTTAPAATNGPTAPVEPESVAGFVFEGETAVVATDDALPFGEASEDPIAEVVAVTPDELAARIRLSAEASDAPGPMTPDQATALGRLLQPLGARAVKAGIETLWPGIDWSKPSAAQADAIVLAANSDPDFEAHWTAMATVEVPA